MRDRLILDLACSVAPGFAELHVCLRLFQKSGRPGQRCADSQRKGFSASVL